MLSRGASWFCTALLGLAAASAAAGSFSVSPTRIELPVGQRTAVISLRNTDTAPLTVQASLVDWAQPAGEDVYTPTRAVLATPPVFTIAPDGSLSITAANSGNTHVQVTGFEVGYGDAGSATAVSVVKYVLPGSRMSWSVKPPAGVDAQRVQIKGHSDRGDFSAEADTVAAR
jgi:P pilus assembly chaperone PapD